MAGRFAYVESVCGAGDVVCAVHAENGESRKMEITSRVTVIADIEVAGETVTSVRGVTDARRAEGPGRSSHIGPAEEVGVRKDALNASGGALRNR